MFGNIFSNIGRVSDSVTKVVVVGSEQTAVGTEEVGAMLIDVARQGRVAAHSELEETVLDSIVKKRELCVKHDVTPEQLAAEMELRFPTKKGVEVPLTVKQLQQQVTAARKAAKAAEEASKQ